MADQLQTNYAGDLRHILKAVFDCYTSDTVPSPEPAEEVNPDEDSPDTSGLGEEGGEFGTDGQGENVEEVQEEVGDEELGMNGEQTVVRGLGIRDAHSRNNTGE